MLVKYRSMSLLIFPVILCLRSEGIVNKKVQISSGMSIFFFTMQVSKTLQSVQKRCETNYINLLEFFFLDFFGKV